MTKGLKNMPYIDRPQELTLVSHQIISPGTNNFIVLWASSESCSCWQLTCLFLFVYSRFSSAPDPWTGSPHGHISSANTKLVTGTSGEELKEKPGQFVPRFRSNELPLYIPSYRTLSPALWCRWRRHYRPFWVEAKAGDIRSRTINQTLWCRLFDQQYHPWD